MATVKKTYSRRNNEFANLREGEKENFDPFDELLSSPLKQEVQFKPLSFWGSSREIRDRQKKPKNFKYGLYEASDSEESPPNNRKKKSKLKFSKCKSRTLPVKSSRKENNNTFSASSVEKGSKATRATMAVESGISVPSEKVKRQKKHSSSKAPHPSQSQAGNSTLKEWSFEEVSNKGGFRNGSARECNLFSLSTQRIDADNTESSQVEVHKTSSPNSVRFSIYEDDGSAEESSGVLSNYSCPDETILHNENDGSEELTLLSDETLVPFDKGYGNDKFISVKRHYSNFEFFNLRGNCEQENWSNSTFKANDRPQNLTFTIHKGMSFSRECLGSTAAYDGDVEEEESVVSAFSPNLSSIDVSSLDLPGCGGETDEDTLSHSDGDSISSTLCGSEIAEKACPFVCHPPVLAEGSIAMSVVEFPNESSVVDDSKIFYKSFKKLDEDSIQKLLLDRIGHSVVAASESGSASDESTPSVTDEESVIRVGLASEANEADCTDEVLPVGLPSTEVSHLENEISQLTISRGHVLSEDEQPQTSKEGPGFKDAKNNSVWIDLRNVTTKRKYRLSDRFQRGISLADESRSGVNPREGIEAEGGSEEAWGSDEGVELEGVTEGTQCEWDKTECFARPIFESTRVMDVSSSDTGGIARQPNQAEKMGSVLAESQSWQSYALKPGKKWLRAVSILKQLRSGNVTGDRLDGSRVKGRKFESFVRDMLEMQNGKCGWSISLADLNYSNEISVSSGVRTPLSHSVSVRNGSLELVSSVENVAPSDSVSPSCSNGTVMETSLINPTIKVINPEEKPSAFALEISELVLDDRPARKDRISGFTARNFVLLQCGQEDVLPFEEYFNERTLKNCVKIGEGVYGEVFKSSDAVIKIIPIEGTEKVNGETQKKFEEILSEVVIALKMSKLRNGESNRTDGFCEMKRCWCVQGRYPKYLLRLWDEYDQAGSGSENDSPIMFKEDQLYIILELTNGGKDLESFVFTSSAQSLSIFIQTAFSLAAAEKAFEFEHRDLHWGNLLISQTKEKFVSITVDNREFKIPSKGVKVCIIDFTLSRIYHEGFCIFNDLSVDPSLFQSEGDYQFEIYKMMLREVGNDWSLFRPKTNIFWLHYTLDKMIHMARYKSKRAVVHKKFERELKTLESSVLDYSNSTDFVQSDLLSDVLKRL